MNYITILDNILIAVKKEVTKHVQKLNQLSRQLRLF